MEISTKVLTVLTIKEYTVSRHRGGVLERSEPHANKTPDGHL